RAEAEDAIFATRPEAILASVPPTPDDVTSCPGADWLRLRSVSRSARISLRIGAEAALRGGDSSYRLPRAEVKALNSKAEVAQAQAALALNICVARGLQDVLRTNLGPKGTMKMLVSGAGDMKLTKDGNVLLHEMAVVDSVLAIRRPGYPIDLLMVEIMEMKHKSETDTK
ncbi:hypothetical protein EI555_013479, partial [Monodon monoceros]